MQCGGDLAQGFQASGLYLFDDGQRVVRELLGDSRLRGVAVVAHVAEDGIVLLAEAVDFLAGLGDALFFERRQRRLGALGNVDALLFGDRRQDVQGKIVHRRLVGHDEVDLALHQVGDEGEVPAQPVQFGDYQRGFFLFAEGDGGGELRPVVFLATLDLDKFTNHFPVATIDPLGDGFPLGVHTEAGGALLEGTDAVIGDIFAGVFDAGCVLV